MELIDLNRIQVRGESKQKSFEDLCMFLLCRKLKVSEISGYRNQPGIETDPIVVRKNRIGFQVKYFESGFDWSPVKKSLLGAEVKINPGSDIELRFPKNSFKSYNLSKVYIYSNEDKTLDGRKKTKPEKEIEAVAAKYSCKVYYITSKSIQLELSKPSNQDLAQLYFGSGNELGFMRGVVSPKALTFINSSDYFELPVLNRDNVRIDNLDQTILTFDGKLYMVTGHPGSGKSSLMLSLLVRFGGLNKPSLQETFDFLMNVGAVPVMINLRNCHSDSLEHILKLRRDDAEIHGNNLKFIYLLDGLDELSESKADDVLREIDELKNKNTTFKIVISCRSGNNNRLKAYGYFKNMLEFRIAELDQFFVTTYIQRKGDPSKLSKFKQLIQTNSTLIEELKDILLIQLFWETIDEISESTTILELFDKRINSILDSPKHQKILEKLNILNPKKDGIINLNREISYEFHDFNKNQFQFRFTEGELQKLIRQVFGNIDNISINTILNYNADLFFENTVLLNNVGVRSFTYSHRRYQEYFFAQKLQFVFEQNRSILRDFKVLSNGEFFENFFLKYLRSEYRKEGNLPGLLELNLIDVYLGKHSGFGVNEAYYMDSDHFIPTLINQESSLFNELMEDSRLELKNKLNIDIKTLKDQLRIWKKKKRDYSVKQYVESVWMYDLRGLIEMTVRLWKAGKYHFAKEFRNLIAEVYSSFTEVNFEEIVEEERHIVNPFWDKLSGWFFIRLVIDEEIFLDFFEKNVRGTCLELVGENKEEYWIRKVRISFFQVAISNFPSSTIKLLPELDLDEKECLLKVLSFESNHRLIAEDQELKTAIIKMLTNNVIVINKRNWFILFFKKVFGLSIQEEELHFVEELRNDLLQSKSLFWANDEHYRLGMYSYILDKSNFSDLLRLDNESKAIFYSERSLFCALFTSYIEMLFNERHVDSILRNYNRYIISDEDLHDFSRENFQYQISRKWAEILSFGSTKKNGIPYKDFLFNKSSKVSTFSFYYRLAELSSSSYSKLVNESDIMSLESKVSPDSVDDLQSYTDHCFMLSRMYSGLNNGKARYYFEKAINDGMLRHGWRKDPIVAYYLIDALNILWRNNWLEREKLEEISFETLRLTQKVYNLTDGKITWRGPSNVVKMISKYSVDLAEKFRVHILQVDSNPRDNVLTKIILLAKVRSGYSLETISEEMNNLKSRYDGHGKLTGEHFEIKMEAFIEIAESNLYFENERKIAFQNAREQIRLMRERNIEYFLADHEYSELKYRYQSLCKRYGQSIDLEFYEKKQEKPKKVISEVTFIRIIKEVKSEQSLKKKYQELNNNNSLVVAKSYDFWEILIDKTLEIGGNIKLFSNFLQNNYYPHSDFYSSLSEWLHLGVAAALKNPESRSEMLEYLYDNSGHMGFVNLMKTYEYLGDKKMCLDLFDRFNSFCHFIVN